MKNEQNDAEEEYHWTEISGIEFQECARSSPSRIITSCDKNIVVSTNNALPLMRQGKVHLNITIAESLTLFSVVKPATFIFNPGMHKASILCVVLTGSVIFGDTELLSGHWIFVPPLYPFTFGAGKTGALVCYCHCRIGQGKRNY